MKKTELKEGTKVKAARMFRAMNEVGESDDLMKVNKGEKGVVLKRNLRSEATAKSLHLEDCDDTFCYNIKFSKNRVAALYEDEFEVV